MIDREQFVARLNESFAAKNIQFTTNSVNEIEVEVPRQQLVEICHALHDDEAFEFTLLMDLCGVDYLEYEDGAWDRERFSVVYHLLSLTHNQRVRIKVFLAEDALIIDSVIEVWASADWYEREAFDLFGILFDGHPDLRRLLTDYGFIGHPFRKDFPLIGHVEVRYDEEKKRVVYEPVTITPRITVPKVIRKDNRYQGSAESSEEQHG